MTEKKLKFVDSLNELRQNGVGCDVVLQVGDRSFLAHRVVLIARIEYFRRILTIDMQDRQRLIVPIEPEIVKPEIFGHILDYVYMFKIDFTADNFKAICKAADYFCFDELLDEGKNYIEKEHSIEEIDVEPLMNLATGNASKELENECEKLLISNPESEIARKLLIPTLSVEYLKKLINKLGTLSKQEEAFNYCMEWILHDPVDRKDRMTELLDTIPLDSLSLPFLKDVVLTNQFVLNNNGVLQLLAFAMANNKHPSTKQPSKLYVLGGKDSRILYSISQYNLETDEWIVSTPLKGERSDFFGVAVKNRKIYVCGGDEVATNKASKNLSVFDTVVNKWNTLTPMNYARESFGMSIIKNYIYVAGGRNENTNLSSVEQYSIATDKWQEIRPMNHERAGLSLVELNGYLYAIGGSINGKPCSIVERYDPEEKVWESVGSMNNTLRWFGSTALNGRIYVCGQRTFEVYDPIADTWKVLPSPTECGIGRQLATFNGRIYSIGGSTGPLADYKGIKTVEYFDVDAQEWFCGKDMDVARCYHCVAVVQD